MLQKKSKEDNFHKIIERNIELSEKRNKELGKPEYFKWYSYKDRLPPNSFDLNVVTNSNGYMEINRAAIVLQHYVSDLFYFDRVPNNTKWLLIKGE